MGFWTMMFAASFFHCSLFARLQQLLPGGEQWAQVNDINAFGGKPMTPTEFAPNQNAEQLSSKHLWNWDVSEQFLPTTQTSLSTRRSWWSWEWQRSCQRTKFLPLLRRILWSGWWHFVEHGLGPCWSIEGGGSVARARSEQLSWHLGTYQTTKYTLSAGCACTTVHQGSHLLVCIAAAMPSQHYWPRLLICHRRQVAHSYLRWFPKPQASSRSRIGNNLSCPIFCPSLADDQPLFSCCTLESALLLLWTITMHSAIEKFKLPQHVPSESGARKINEKLGRNQKITEETMNEIHTYNTEFSLETNGEACWGLPKNKSK